MQPQALTSHQYALIRKQLDARPDILKAKLDRSALRMLLAPYSTKVIYPTGEWGLFGRDSLQACFSVHTTDDCDKTRPAFTMGHLVETAGDCQILTGGEHYNDQVLNHTMNNWIYIRNDWNRRGIPRRKSFSRGAPKIGSNVTISQRATVLSGVAVGDGAVVGAGSLVTKDVPPFAVVAGNPARVLRYRFDEAVIEDLLAIRWWDFSPEALLKHIDDIQNLHRPEIRAKLKELAPRLYRKDENLLAFKRGDAAGNQIHFVGAEVAGGFIPTEKLPEVFRFFIEQINTPPGSVVCFIPDIFSFSGLAGA